MGDSNLTAGVSVILFQKKDLIGRFGPELGSVLFGAGPKPQDRTITKAESRIAHLTRVLLSIIDPMC